MANQNGSAAYQRTPHACLGTAARAYPHTPARCNGRNRHYNLRLSERSGAGNDLPKACPDSRAATRSPNTAFFGRLLFVCNVCVRWKFLPCKCRTHPATSANPRLLPAYFSHSRPQYEGCRDEPAEPACGHGTRRPSTRRCTNSRGKLPDASRRARPLRASPSSSFASR